MGMIFMTKVYVIGRNFTGTCLDPQDHIHVKIVTLSTNVFKVQ